MNKRIFLVWLLSAFCCSISARDYPMQHYTQQDGLPSNTVYSIYQDTDGMIWFATDKGVARYNGLKFEHFTTNNGLPDNDIFFFQKDREGRLWMATYNGDLVFYKNGIFHTAKNTPFLCVPGVRNNTQSIQLMDNGNLLVTFGNNYTFLVIKQDTITSITAASDSLTYSSVITWRDIHYLVVHYLCTITLNNRGKRIKTEPTKLISANGIGDYWAHFQHEKKDIKIFGPLFDRKGIVVCQLQDTFSSLNIINTLYQGTGHFFVSTNYGLWMDSMLLFRNINVSGVLQDRQGNYWVSTLKQGVYKLPGNFLAVCRYNNAYSSTATNILPIGDSFILGTEQKDMYQLTDTGLQCFFRYSKAYGRPANPLSYSIVSYDPSTLYHLSFTDNFRIRTDKEYIPEPLPKLYQAAGMKNTLFNKGILYLQSGASIYALRPSELFSPVFGQKLIPGSDTDKRIYQVRMDPDSNIWYTDVKRVFKINQGKAVPQTQFGSFTFRELIFCRNFLIGIDPANRMIIASNYNSKQILIDSSIANNCIWDKYYALTDSSVLVTTNDYYRVVTFGCKDCPKGYRIDILEYPFIPQLAEKIYSNGATCYFFKDGNVTCIPVKELITAPALPELRFTFIRNRQQQTPADTLARLSFDQSRELSVYYNVQSFNTRDISYEYSITRSGQPYNWVSSNGASISLFNMAQGDYSISIRAVTFGGRYSVVKTMQLYIASPFWLTWWFIFGIILLLGIIALLAIRLFLRRKLVIKERENKFLRSEFTALNALMNPHFVFNSLNSVQSLINKEDLQAANQYVRTISDLLRQNMHNISREMIPLSKEMELIDNYMKLEKLRFKERLQYTITIAEDVEEEFVMVPPLLVQPLVENAIKYTLAFSEISTGMVRVDIYNENDHTIIDVTDNGKGLNAARKQKDPGHESTALGNIRTRLEQLSQIHGKEYVMTMTELKDEQENVTGTRVRISIEL